ncbi:hypothetical protein [Microvirga roseola]|uniref:hypothetical protein n=1 Tax=Microvirga roseola TaxID=2883126 RepID=UPI001E63B1DE|nr:hypothetical protein [Microvirga roseola]
MFSAPATAIGVAGVVFLAGSFAPASFSIASLTQSEDFLRPVLMAPATVPIKGDRIADPAPAAEQATVSTVELIGVSRATVILRDRHGEVLYRSDPESGITAFTKNTDLPVITLKEEPRRPGPQHPVVVRDGRESHEPPQETKPKRRNPVGCLADVSPLARASADRSPSLCLALLDHSLS